MPSKDSDHSGGAPATSSTGPRAVSPAASPAAPVSSPAPACPSGGHVWFVGAGPGDPELLTLKARRIIAEADLVLYAGSLVPPQVVACARPDARVVDSAPLTLEQTHALLRATALAGGTAARVHTGDPSLYGTVREQMRLLHAEGIACSVVPGVTAAFAAAAAAGVSFTAPEVTQSLVITRLEGRTPVPDAERLRELARHGSAMAVYLSAAAPERLQEELAAAGVAPHTPVLAAHRVGWPDQALAWTTAGGLAETMRTHGFSRQTVFLVLPGEAAGDTASRLYAADFAHGWRHIPPAGEDGGPHSKD
ncbi:precorrin-4 C(11)-methyltransferase [Nitratidesulfovibrio sp.]|uniref:precorrin-4 C(11)-methyltransferase n=1 Tax=Nitratidesulfovibrio sp. TaxID=2802297 RepID=UPI003341BE15